MKRMKHSAACQKLGWNATNEEVFRVCPLCRARLLSEGFKVKTNPSRRSGVIRQQGAQIAARRWWQKSNLEARKNALGFVGFARAIPLMKHRLGWDQLDLTIKGAIVSAVAQARVAPRKNPVTYKKADPRFMWESMGGDTLRALLRRLGVANAADISYRYWRDVPPSVKTKFTRSLRAGTTNKNPPLSFKVVKGMRATWTCPYGHIQFWIKRHKGMYVVYAQNMATASKPYKIFSTEAWENAVWSAEQYADQFNDDQPKKNPTRRSHSAACQKLGWNATNAEVYRVCPLCRARLISEGWKPKK